MYQIYKTQKVSRKFKYIFRPNFRRKLSTVLTIVATEP